MQIVAASIGLLLGMTIWFAASHLLASSIIWVENRYPKIAGSKSMRAYETVICGLLVVSCFAIAVWVMRMFTK